MIEFNLSDNVIEIAISRKKPLWAENSEYIRKSDVKEFIRLLKEKLKGDLHYNWTIQEIDKLAGKQLIE